MKGGLPRQDERAERARRARSDQKMYIGKQEECIDCEKSCLSRKDKTHTRPSRVCVFTLAFPLGSIRDCMYNTESRHMREETREGDEFIQLFSLIKSAVTAQLVGFH